jgi:hypothetical protein
MTLERLHQESGQGLLVAGAEPGKVTWSGAWLVAKDPEGDVLDAAPLDLPRGAHPQAVAIEQHAKQGLGVVGRVAVPVRPVCSVG